MRRPSGESMRKWTSRFEGFIRKTGKAVHQADAEIDEATFLHHLIQGILLLECGNLSPAEMRRSWLRVEQRQRKQAPLETAICLLIWPQASLPSGTMRHSCVETRLHRNVRITLQLRRQQHGISSPLSTHFSGTGYCGELDYNQVSVCS